MSTSLLNLKPRGIKALNSRPVWAILGVIGCLLMVFAYTFKQRIDSRDAVLAAATEHEASGAGSHADGLFGDDPTRPAAKQDKKPDTNSNPPPPPATIHDLAEEARVEKWREYFKRSSQEVDAADERRGHALLASSDTAVSLTAPGAGAGAGGQTSMDPNGGAPGGGGQQLAYGGGLSGGGMGTLGGGGAQPAGVDAGAQAEKRNFLRQDGDLLGKDENLKAVKHAAKPNTIMAGTAIPGVMVGGMTSDMPGMVVGQIDTNIYDSQGMLPPDQPLIPAGTRVVGRYDNSVSYGQERVGVIWNRLIFPDGSSLQIGSQEGADSAGYAGFHDIVNTHFWDKFWAATVISLAGAAAQLSQPQQSAFQGYSPASVASASMTQGYAQLGQEYARAGLSIPNTLEIRPGYRFTIMVHNDWRLPVYVDSRFFRPRLGGVKIN